MKAALPAPFAEKCVDMANRIQCGSSIEEETARLRGETITNYTKARIMYELILWLLQPRDMATEAAFTFLLDWRREILRDGLFANADIPDDNKMRKILCADGQSLLECVRMVYKQLEANVSGQDKRSQ